MRRRFGSWVRPMAGLLALTLALAIAGPASAAEPASKLARPQTLTVAAKAHVAAAALPAADQAKAQAAPASTTTSTSKGFFGTAVGKTAVVLMAAGTGFMVYSAFHDNNPVHSQFR